MNQPTVSRRGAINPVLVTFLAGVAAVVALVLLLPGGNRPGRSGENKPLTMLVAAGIRTPVEQILQQYEQEYGVAVQVQYGGSNMLLNHLKVDKFQEPDLYLAADAFYTQTAVDQGLAAEVFPVAVQEPVVAWRKTADFSPASWQALLAKSLRWSQADPDQAAVGRSTRDVLKQVAAVSGVPEVSNSSATLWDQLSEQTVQRGVFKPTVNEVANDLKIGAVDLGIVWNSTLASPEYRDELTGIPIRELLETSQQTDIGDELSLAVLTSSSQPTAALKLARYLTAADRGLLVFAEFGMTPVAGDTWVEHPEVTFFCGAVNRRAIEPVLAAFQQREGVTINTVYDGCGILTSRMGAIDGQQIQSGFPDVYMACDRYYLENVQDWFQEAVDVSQTEIVLVVPKGSEKVRELADLIQPGVRVSVGEPDQCTIGALTRRLLRQAGLYDSLKQKQQTAGEVVVEKSSSALIVPDVLTGHVDVAVAYRNDVLDHREQVDLIAIPGPLTQAIQPLSLAKNSQHKQLIRRLYQHVAKAGPQFEAVGFEFLFRPEKSGP